ncbi:hypothetical protein K7432_000714 [Basidiobolus ranarum]
MSRLRRVDDVQHDLPMEDVEESRISSSPNLRRNDSRFTSIHTPESTQRTPSPSTNSGYSLPRLPQLDASFDTNMFQASHSYQPISTLRLNSTNANHEAVSPYSDMTRLPITTPPNELSGNRRSMEIDSSFPNTSGNRSLMPSHAQPEARYYYGSSSHSPQQYSSITPNRSDQVNLGQHSEGNSAGYQAQTYQRYYSNTSNISSPRTSESSSQPISRPTWNSNGSNSQNFDERSQPPPQWSGSDNCPPDQNSIIDARPGMRTLPNSQAIPVPAGSASLNRNHTSGHPGNGNLAEMVRQQASRSQRTAPTLPGTSRGPGSNSNKMDFETLVKRYFWQIMYGCSQERCTNRYCASNPAFAQRDPNEAAALSLSLAEEGDIYLCPDISELGGDLSMHDMKSKDQRSLGDSRKRVRDTFDEFNNTETNMKLDSDALSSMISECHSTKNYRPLYQTLYCVFGNLDNLSRSFQQANPELQKTYPVDLFAVKQAYEMVIQQCPKRARNAILSGTTVLFEKILAKVEVIKEQHLVIFLMVLMNPLLMDPVEHHDIMPKLCDALLSQSLPLQKRLCDYISAPLTTDHSHFFSLDADPKAPHPVTCEFFQHYVSVFQQFITMHLLLRPDESITPNKNEAVMKATKCLEVLYVLNEEKHFVSFTEFYNDAINEQIEIKEDFPRYKTKDGFSFCNYAFILNPATKSDILKVESMVQMRHELQDAFFRALFIGVNSPYLVLEIRRSHIIRDALFQLESKDAKDLKKQLRVQFVGEEGVDEGGVQKEFFQLVVSEMFDQKYGMFSFNEESRTCWFMSNPLVDEAQLEEYRLIGRLIGLAIYNSVILDVRFPFSLYKKLMGQKVGLADLKNLDPTLTHGLEQLLEFDGDVAAAFERTFQIENEYLDGRFTYDLKPGGEDIKLTEDNRKEFVDLYVDFILNKSVERQFNAFKEGFDNVCAGSAIQLFRPEEVEQLICGSSDLDFEALERVTQYDGGFSKDSAIIK